MHTNRGGNRANSTKRNKIWSSTKDEFTSENNKPAALGFIIPHALIKTHNKIAQFIAGRYLAISCVVGTKNNDTTLERPQLQRIEKQIRSNIQVPSLRENYLPTFLLLLLGSVDN